MRGIIFSLMALLVMTSVAIADPVLSVVPDDYYVGTGYKSFKVQVTGTNVNVLSTFTITGSRTATVGDVYQVFNTGGVQTTWSGDGSTHSAMDSYVMFGSLWEPLGGNPITAGESIVTSGGTDQGMGRLTNYSNNGTPEDPADDKMDAFARLVGVDYQLEVPGTADVFHLVLPDGAYATVAAKLLTTDQNPEDGNKYNKVTTFDLSTVVKCPLDGDANQDGKVTLLDATIMGGNWQQAGGWSQGDFSGDGQITLLDATMLGGNWQAQADWYGMAEGTGGVGAVPEPATLIMLVLGSLCLVGYRLRK